MKESGGQGSGTSMCKGGYRRIQMLIVIGRRQVQSVLGLGHVYFLNPFWISFA